MRPVPTHEVMLKKPADLFFIRLRNADPITFWNRIKLIPNNLCPLAYIHSKALFSASTAPLAPFKILTSMRNQVQVFTLIMRIRDPNLQI